MNIATGANKIPTPMSLDDIQPEQIPSALVHLIQQSVDTALTLVEPLVEKHGDHDICGRAILIGIFNPIVDLFAGGQSETVQKRLLDDLMFYADCAMRRMQAASQGLALSSIQTSVTVGRELSGLRLTQGSVEILVPSDRLDRFVHAVTSAAGGPPITEPGPSLAEAAPQGGAVDPVGN